MHKSIVINQKKFVTLHPTQWPLSPFGECEGVNKRCFHQSFPE